MYTHKNVKRKRHVHVDLCQWQIGAKKPPIRFVIVTNRLPVTYERFARHDLRLSLRRFSLFSTRTLSVKKNSVVLLALSVVFEAFCFHRVNRFNFLKNFARNLHSTKRISLHTYELRVAACCNTSAESKIDLSS